MRLIVLLFLFFLSLNIFSQDFSISNNILVLHSYHQGLEWTDSVTEGILSAFDENDEDFIFYFEYLDTKRNPSKEYFNRLIEFEKQKHNLADLNFELIFACDNDALDFMVSHGDELFGDVPIVFCGINNFSKSLINDKENITGVVEVVDYHSTLSVMKELHPNRSKIILIMDTTTTGEATREEVSRILPDFSDHFDFEFYTDFLVSDLEEKFSSLSDDYLLYLMAFNTDRNGVFNSYTSTIRKLRRYSPVPIYSSWDFFFNEGIIGGSLTSGFVQGEKAGKMGKEILSGTPVSSIPIDLTGINQYQFDYRELNRFGIEINNLPDDSIISNRPYLQVRENQILLIIIFILIIPIPVFMFYMSKFKRKSDSLMDLNKGLNKEIEVAQTTIETLRELLPICAHCKKIRDDNGYWNQIETYFSKHSNIDFSHGLCPECAKELYPKIFKKKDK